MKEDKTAQRKKEHLELCSTDDVNFKFKTNGFEKYDFIHNAITEVEIDEINFETKLFKEKIETLVSQDYKIEFLGEDFESIVKR